MCNTLMEAKFQMMEEQGERCGCKGIRTCLICEETKDVHAETKGVKVYEYCSDCERAWESGSSHPHHQGHSLPFHGIYLLRDFITKEEETCLDEEINKSPWIDSQSGRRKQDYGPKVNFKKKKVKTHVFTGLPKYSLSFYERMKKLPLLKNFLPVELCNLEYVPEKGSAIDPHFDDFWLWGERLVTWNLISDTVLTMTHDGQPDIEVAVQIPARSLLVVYGPARYEWKHAVKRHNIHARRLAITLRELTPHFLQGGEQELVGKELLDIALSFEGISLASRNLSLIS